MKNLLLVLTFLTPFFVSAQTEIGIKAGSNFSFPSSDLKSDFGNGTFGFEVGVYSREKKGAVNILVEGLYSNISFKETGKKLSINSLKVPFLLEFGNKVKFSAGVAPVITLSAKVKGSETLKSEDLRKVNIFPCAGITFTPADRLNINARAYYATMSYLENRNYNPVTASITLSYGLFEGE